ncbi:MAG: hypothetical protein NTW54_06950 [Bacteroidetes bacterium]|nr:hypothetical protein [Bacteroidota bacterium]
MATPLSWMRFIFVISFTLTLLSKKISIMAFIEKIQDINLRVANIIKQQQQLKSQAQNWEHLYKEATEVQKKLIEQSTENIKRIDALSNEITTLKTDLAASELKHQQLIEKQNNLTVEHLGLKSENQNISNELHALRLKEEQQLTLHFGNEKEQEQLKAICEDLKEQLQASQQLNTELQTDLQASKIAWVEEQAQATTTAQQKNSLEKELTLLKDKYQTQLSELHSKISHSESQTEKGIAEKRKLQENVAELTQSNENKQAELTLFQEKLGEMEIQLSLPPELNENSALISQIEQLTAQIANLEFERDLIKETHLLAENARPTKIVETSNQGSGSNDDQIHFLYAELQTSQALNSELENQIHSYIDIIAEQTKKAEAVPSELKNLAEQNKIVKLAEAIEGNTVASNIELKQKLSEMIKEVDRCIAKLSS